MNVWAGLLKAVLLLAALSILITIFRGLLAWFTDIKVPWSPRAQKTVATIIVVSLVCGSYLLVRGKVCASKQDFLSLREVATNAYHRRDYNSVIGIMSWVLQFEKDDDSFFRLRALAYKRLHDYQSEISDREKAFQLNPGRDRNHLPIIEDYIFLGEYDKAEAWTQHYGSSISDSDIQTMFEFFDLVCEVLKGKEHSSRVAHLKGTIGARPLSKDFIQGYWEWEPLGTLIEASQVSSEDKMLLHNIGELMQRTAK